MDAPRLAAQNSGAIAAANAFASGLQAGHDSRDSDVLNAQFAADLAWGSPFGALVLGFDELHTIHTKFQARAREGHGPFSEMAMYVLVRRDGEWWLAAGQNTPMRAGGAVAAEP